MGDFTDDMFGAMNDEFTSQKQEKFDLYIEQKGRKYKTSVQGWQRPSKELKEILKKLKKSVCQCSGSIEEDDQGRELIILFGDQRDKVVEYLMSVEKIPEGDITVHGV